MKKIRVQRNVAYVIPRNCWLCLHVGTTAIYFGSREIPGVTPRRLELFTPWQRFRWTTPRCVEKRKAQKRKTQRSSY